jgi:SAM-dependent methyltransferase
MGKPNIWLARCCPYCDGEPAGPAFPFANHYAGLHFRYFGCVDCGTRYIDPAPDAETLARLYAPDSYHAQFYDDGGHADYAGTAGRLAKHLGAGARVLDYGCGAGHLIAALKQHGLDAYGVEFTAQAAADASKRTGRPVYAIEAGDWRAHGPWDCIHMGDVIEHLAEPAPAVDEILTAIRPGGLLSVEGPLEANLSAVSLAAELFGRFKQWRHPARMESFPPYHLVFTTAKAQREFFGRRALPLQEILWTLNENGWPYRNNGGVRNAIALMAIGLNRMPLIGSRFGNRFTALYRVLAR